MCLLLLLVHRCSSAKTVAYPYPRKTTAEAVVAVVVADGNSSDFMTVSNDDNKGSSSFSPAVILFLFSDCVSVCVSQFFLSLRGSVCQSVCVCISNESHSRPDNLIAPMMEEEDNEISIHAVASDGKERLIDLLTLLPFSMLSFMTERQMSFENTH